MKNITLLFLSLTILSACSGVSASKETSIRESEIVEQDLTTLNDKDSLKQPTKTYINEGLKYLTVIVLEIKDSGDVFGKISSVDYIFLDEDNDERYHKAFFKGNIKANQIKVEFEDAPPVIGDNSKWTEDDWRVEVINDIETLVIPFYAKNYETLEWKMSDYEFPLSDKYSEYKWFNINNYEQIK